MVSSFKRIRILDATVFQLPDSFATDYQGSGGSSNTAGVKIQLEYDLLSSQFLNVQLGPGKNNDKTYGTICLETVEAGDLCLRDLGYFDLGDLQAIHDKEAYYISRLLFFPCCSFKNFLAFFMPPMPLNISFIFSFSIILEFKPSYLVSLLSFQ
jgi:hypothetical protein